MDVSFGSTYNFSLMQNLAKKSKKDAYNRTKLLNIIETRFPNQHVFSENKDFVCLSVKEKADSSVVSILKKYGIKFLSKNGKHNLKINEMKNLLDNYIKRTSK